MLLQEIEADVRKDASMLITKIESEAKEEAEKHAKEVITMAIQKCAYAIKLTSIFNYTCIL